MTALEIFRARYDEEWTKQGALQQNTSAATGLMTLLGTGLIFLGQKGLEQTMPFGFVFWTALAVATSAWVAAGGILIRSMVRVRYRTVAPANEWREYHKRLIEESDRFALGQLAVDSEFADFGCDAYADAATVNWTANHRRGRLLFWANAAFVVAVAFAVLSAIPLGLEMRTRSPDVHQVRITNFPERLSVPKAEIEAASDSTVAQGKANTDSAKSAKVNSASTKP